MSIDKKCKLNINKWKIVDFCCWLCMRQILWNDNVGAYNKAACLTLPYKQEKVCLMARAGFVMSVKWQTIILGWKIHLNVSKCDKHEIKCWLMAGKWRIFQWNQRMPLRLNKVFSDYLLLWAFLEITLILKQVLKKTVPVISTGLYKFLGTLDIKFYTSVKEETTIFWI